MRKQSLVLLSAAAFSLFALACSDDSSSVSGDPSSSSGEIIAEESSSSADSTETSSSSDSTEASSSSVSAPTNGLLIDNFESKDETSVLGTSWYTYTDGSNDGASTIETSTAAVGNGAAYGIYFTLDQGGYQYAPYVGWGVEIPGTVDVTKYSGIRYSYKGSAHYVRLETSDVTDYDVHLLSVKKSSAWTTVTIAFDDLAQEGWGVNVPFDPSHVTALSFQAKGKTGGTVVTDSVIIDDIYFITSEDLPPKTADMQARDPVVYNDTIGDITISTSLQEKAMKYLNKGVNFTNWLEEADGKFTGEFEFGESDVKLLGENGFKALRLPIDLDLYVDNRAEFLNDSTGTVSLKMNDSLFMVLDSFVNWTERYGMSFTIDYHEYDNSYNTTSATDAQYLSMMANVWKAVAEHYASNPREDIFFELLNEPDMTNGKVSADNWTTAAQGMIDSIRKVDKVHTIIFGDAQWYSMKLLAKRMPFADDNIIYAIHTYEPFIFSHQGASWSYTATIKNLPFPYDKETWSLYSSDYGVNASTPSNAKSAVKSYYKTGSKGYILNQVLPAKKWAVEHQVPIIINEFGAYRLKSDAQSVLNYLTAMREISDTLQIPLTHWGYTGGFSVVEDGKVIDGVAEALGLE